MPETVDEIVKPTSTNRGAVSSRAIIEEDIDGTSLAGEDTGHVDVIGGRIERRIPDSIKDKLAWLTGDDSDDDEVDEKPAVDAKADDAKPAVGDDAKPTGESKPVEVVKPAEVVPDANITRAERAEEANRRLLEENDGLKKRPAGAAAHAKLIAASEQYLEDPIGAMRQFIAHVFNVEDANAPEVVAEMSDLYTDLTAKELGSSLDAAHQAKREAARTKQLFLREKRQRKADEERATQATSTSVDEQRIAKAGEHIVGLLKAEAHPYLFELAEALDGKTPGEIVARILQREINTGRIDPKQPDEQLAKLAAEIANTHYQTIADKTIAARSKTTSTDRPSTDEKSPVPAAATSARTEQRQSHGARNLTAADASVAPAKPPADKPKPAEKPKFRTRQDRIDHTWQTLREPKR